METEGPDEKDRRNPNPGAKEGGVASAVPILKMVPPARKTLPEVYAEEFEFVWRLLARFGLNDAAAEDAAQEVFIRFHGNFDSWDQSRPVRALLAGYAWHVASEHRKRASTRYEQLAREEMPDAGHDGHARMDGRIDSVRMIERALAPLSEEQRDIVILHLVEERPMSEVSEILNVPENTLSSRLRAARAIFLPRLQRMMQGRP